MTDIGLPVFRCKVKAGKLKLTYTIAADTGASAERQALLNVSTHPSYKTGTRIEVTVMRVNRSEALGR